MSRTSSCVRLKDVFYIGPTRVSRGEKNNRTRSISVAFDGLFAGPSETPIRALGVARGSSEPKVANGSFPLQSCLSLLDFQHFRLLRRTMCRLKCARWRAG